MNPIVYVVDDNPSVRHGLRTLLEISGYAVETFDSGEALLTRQPSGWGCILLDMRMEDMDGLQVQQSLLEQKNTLPILFLTAFSNVPHTVRAMKNGAEDFLIKPVDGEFLVNRVQQVLEKSREQAECTQLRQAFSDRIANLTSREREVMLLSQAGLSCKDIALKLSLSHRTIELHRSHICSKTGTENLGELFRQASKLKFSFA